VNGGSGATQPDTRAALWPVHDVPETADQPADGVGLCLSGGGYRAMLFHVGAIWRLNDVGYLGKLARISSVSGGSITAGVLGLVWSRLQFHDGRSELFEPEVVDPIRSLASTTIDAHAMAAGIFLPGDIASRVVERLDDVLFKGAVLQDLPTDPPRFVINATNLESGALWRFSRPYAGDHRVGRVPSPRTKLATAVAASAAFPPFLSPVELEVPYESIEPDRGTDLHKPEFAGRIDLSDGGVYDNLGLEAVFKRYRTVLVSDGGGQFKPDPDPPNDWLRHMLRVLQVMDNQVRSLRKRQLIAAYKAGDREGAYWGIGTSIAHIDPQPPDLLPAPHSATMRLAFEPTRLAKLNDERQEQLINWGHAACDSALRTHVDPGLAAPARFPYAASGVGPDTG
jgi:NTE family protein